MPFIPLEDTPKCRMNLLRLSLGDDRFDLGKEGSPLQIRGLREGAAEERCPTVNNL